MRAAAALLLLIGGCTPVQSGTDIRLAVASLCDQAAEAERLIAFQIMNRKALSSDQIQDIGDAQVMADALCLDQSWTIDTHARVNRLRRAVATLESLSWGVHP